MVRSVLTRCAAALLLVAAAASGATAASSSTKAASEAGPESKAVVAAVTASATPVATLLGAKLGRPSCPPVEKARVGLTLQCTVAFDKSPIAWLVTLRANSVLEAAPTFPVVSRRQAELVAGTGSTCQMASFTGIPVGATVTCAAGKATTTLTVAADGSLRR
jgi:hypothetical protein